jgi:CRP-like cAMP-binding protein
MPTSDEPLAQLPLLAGLDADEFLAVASRFSREEFSPGTRILEENYIGIKLYVLVEGRVRVYRHMGGTQLLINTLGPPETFGEISVIDGGLASASVEAETDVVALSLQNNDFHALMESSVTLRAKVLENLLKTMCQRIRSTTNQVQDYFAINQALCQNENFRKFYQLLCL